MGLAHALAQSGLRTLLIDISDSILQSALGRSETISASSVYFTRVPAVAPRNPGTSRFPPTMTFCGMQTCNRNVTETGGQD